MAYYNTVGEILTAGNISLEDFPQESVELGIAEAQRELDTLVPTLQPTDRGYAYYARRMPIAKSAHAYLTLSYIMGRLAYEEITHGVTGDPLGLPDISRGAVTPEKNTIAQFYSDESKRYRQLAEDLIRRARYRIPIVKRPKPLEL
jgi:hypothetical protein